MLNVMLYEVVKCDALQEKKMDRKQLHSFLASLIQVGNLIAY